MIIKEKKNRYMVKQFRGKSVSTPVLQCNGDFVLTFLTLWFYPCDFKMKADFTPKWRATGTRGEGNKSGQEGDGEVFLSFASICFLIFFCFYRLIQETLTELQNRGKRLLRFEITGVKSQSLKRRGKIIITLWNRGRNAFSPNNLL